MASSIKKIVFYFLLVVMFGRCISNSSNDTPSNISSNIPVDSVNQLINGESEGLWNELYPDGSPKWKGFYSKGKRIYQENIEFDKPKFSFDTDSNQIKANVPFELKVAINNIHPDDLILTCNNGVIRTSKNSNFNFTVYPNHKGQLKLEIYFMFLSDKTLIGEKKIRVY